MILNSVWGPRGQSENLKVWLTNQMASRGSVYVLETYKEGQCAFWLASNVGIKIHNTSIAISFWICIICIVCIVFIAYPSIISYWFVFPQAFFKTCMRLELNNLIWSGFTFSRDSVLLFCLKIMLLLDSVLFTQWWWRTCILNKYITDEAKIR